MSTQAGSVMIAIQRVGRGILGTWCVVGPLLLLYAYDQFGLLIMLLVIVVGCYAIGIWKWRDQGFSFIRAVGIDVVLTFLFAGVGGAIGGLIAALGGPALHKMGGLTLVYVLVGFWILEWRKSRLA